MSTGPVEFCSYCGWDHASIVDCWRKTRQEALDKLADPTLSDDLRTRLQAALDEFERYRLETIDFFHAANAE